MRHSLDKVFAPLALIAFAAYMALIIWHVPRFGLVAVTLISLALGAYDFARTFWLWRRSDAIKANNK